MVTKEDCSKISELNNTVDSTLSFYQLGEHKEILSRSIKDYIQRDIFSKVKFGLPLDFATKLLTHAVKNRKIMIY